MRGMDKKRMDEKERYQKAEAFATEKHKGQFRIGGVYYASFSGGGNREKSRLWDGLPDYSFIS